MNKISARTLLGYTTEQLWSILTGSFILVFDNGEEIVTDYKMTLFSSYAWDFHREYPDTPMLPNHHIKVILGDKRLGADTHLVLLGNVMWAVYEKYSQRVIDSGIPEIEFRDSLAEKIYRYTNVLYNDLSYRLEEYVTSIDITDFINAINCPAIKNANNSVEETQQSIDKTYKAINTALMNGIDLPNNPISLAARSKLVSIKQVFQCIGPRGYLTDTDSTVFHQKPVLRGYAQGLRGFYDTFVESRSAAKSLLFSKTPLQQAEYFSRRLQLMSQIVRNLHMGDCGTTEYLLWYVRGPVIENGILKRAGDLKQLVGKRYMDSDGILKTITADSHELVGKTLKLRSVIHCAHPDPYGICSTCFGELSLSVPEDTNIGQMCCTSLAQKSSQNVMSVKHHDGSSVVDGIVLSDVDKQYLKVAPDDNSYLLADKLKGLDVKIIISVEQANNISDVLEVKDIGDLNITRVSELAEIGISTKVGSAYHIETISVNLGQRLASMTYPLLGYIKQYGWVVDERGNYVIDMKEWDWSKEILTLPLRHFNMSDHSSEIARMLESSVGKTNERDGNVSPDVALTELFDLVNDKLVVNLAALEVVLYGSMVISADKNQYGLPKPWTENGLGVMRLSMANRSLSAAMAYEGHREIFISANSYIYKNRPDHPMDGLLLPGEVFKYSM